jgi:8-oxo-dGTP pyrophosphatase MutT (NUDIX family)
VVFPGGVVDADDDRLASAWFGDPDERVRACAVRELAEEAGLVLTGAGLHVLAQGESIEDAVAADPPPFDVLPGMARWRAPEILPVRFDAWFYAVAAPAGTPATPDMVEVDDAWWERPADALARHELWTALMWPTYRTLEALTACSSVEDVLRLRVSQDPPPPDLLASYRSPEWQR